MTKRMTRRHGRVPFPQDWVEYIHPEGNTYYYNAPAGVVTNTDPRRDGVTADFTNALENIHHRLSTFESKSDNFEVYLGIPDGSALEKGVVEYYVVDYGHRSIFWVEDVDISTDLSGPASVLDQFESTDHLRLALEPEFWMHLEYYPCHQPTYDHKAEKELTAVFRHGCVDDMTAPGSVFPYSADDLTFFGNTKETMGQLKATDEAGQLASGRASPGVASSIGMVFRILE
ncbi:hypothetical protein FS837_007295 [Tulasnella sp. UAMH 9824]|nr:hypothetical protein FS837_007295 [Tulasnella sp. UAMH 9824]